MNVEHRTLNIEHRMWVSLRSVFFNKIETPKAYPNSTLEVRCSMLDVRFLIRG
jgi:hypothetical protein